LRDRTTAATEIAAVVVSRVMRLAAILCCLIPTAAFAQDFGAVDAHILSVVSAESLPGASIIVIRDGVTVHERHFGTYGPSTQILIASATKWMSGAVIAGLVQDGVLDWDDTVGEFFPAASSEKRPITLRQLFSHTSGMRGDEGTCLSIRNTTLAACAAALLSEPLAYVPGAGFWYGGNSMQVAGRIAEIASGRSWESLFAQYVAGPLALTATAYDLPNPRIGGGIRSTPRDYARFVQMMQQRGSFEGRAIFAPEIVAEMQLDQTLGAPIIESPDPVAFGYGIGVWRNLVDGSGDAVQVSSTGAFGASPWIDNERRLAVVLFWKGAAGSLPDEVKATWMLVRDAVVAHDEAIGLQFFDGFEY
jgi:CubicO group peptidase (beta-lactamase class C family)